MALLDVDRVTVRFGGLVALSDVTFAVDAGEFVSVIGPNGAGKTTLFNVVTGLHRPSSGQLRFQGRAVGRTPARVMSLRGVGRTFQVARPFGSLSVRENLRLAAGMHARHGRLGALRRRSRDRGIDERVGDLLELTGLTDVAGRRADGLNTGGLRRLEMARALAGEPVLLLLDEPAAGIGADGLRPLAALLRELTGRGITVLMVEHHVGFALSLCDRVIVLDEGHKIAEGGPAAIRTDERVIRAYLGAPAEASG